MNKTYMFQFTIFLGLNQNTFNNNIIALNYVVLNKITYKIK